MRLETGMLLAEHALSGKYRRLIYKMAFSWGFVNARQNFVLRPD